MKFLKVTLSIMLVLGFVMTPSCVFAYENSFPTSESISGFSVNSLSTITNLNPMVKVSGGKSSTSSSKKIKDSDDDDSNSTDDGNNWWIWIIVVIIIIAIIIGIWFFFLRNR